MAHECALEIEEANLDYPSLDPRTALCYLSTMCTPQELHEARLAHLIPARWTNLGRKPTPYTPELSRKPTSTNEADLLELVSPTTSKWRPLPSQPTRSQSWPSRSS